MKMVTVSTATIMSFPLVLVLLAALMNSSGFCPMPVTESYDTFMVQMKFGC